MSQGLRGLYGTFRRFGRRDTTDSDGSPILREIRVRIDGLLLYQLDAGIF